MATIGTLPPLTRPPLLGAARPGHARTLADRRPVTGATLLGILEALLVIAALAAVLVVSNRGEMPRGGLDSFLSMRITLKNVLLLGLLVAGAQAIFRVCGLYTVGGVRTVGGETLRAVLGCAVVAQLALLLQAFTTGGGLRPAAIVAFFVAITCGTLAIRQARRVIARTGRRRRVLIVGTGRRAATLSRRFETELPSGYEIAGFLDTPGSTPASEDIARRSVGTLDDLESLLMRHAIDEVCVALPVKSHYPEIQEAILVCERVGVRATYQANLFESQLAWAHYDDPSSPTVTMHVVPNDYRLAIKRLLDIVGAMVAIVVLSPLMLAVALAIRASGPGPVIFAQERYGLNRRRFRMFKFRTMRCDAEALQAALESRNEADGPVFKIADDPRVTPIGRLLRRTSIDELPQFFNVLRGEMSLVGPRPLPLRDVTRFTSASDMRRFSVRPGLTCLWQISGRSSLTFADWIRLDLKYIDGWSLALDFVILLRTVPAVLSGSGAR